MSTYEQAQQYAPKLNALREQIHRHPERGNREFQTASLVEETLHSLGIRTQRLTETAIAGTLQGGHPGPVIALRADMDALPVTEETGAAFASEVPGVMHACGHDVHTTAALGAAMLLAKQRDDLHGAVRFFFQPDEEGNGGAARMIAAGCMDGVEAVFGAHVDPNLPEGVIGVRYGKFYAASDVFKVTFHGRTAHGATPEKGIDALAAAADAAMRAKHLAENILSDPAVLHVGILRAGTAGNIVADTAEIGGMMRTLGSEAREQLKQALRGMIAAVDAAHGTHADISISGSYGGIVNTDAETAVVQRIAEALFGKGQVRLIDAPLMTTEDFGYFIDAAKGSFYHIGAGCTAPLHNSRFLPTPCTIIRLAALHADIIGQYLLEKATNV